MKWEKGVIGEYCVVTSSKRFHLSERCSCGVPFFCSKEIIQKIKGEPIKDCTYISEETYESVKKQFGVPEPGDLLITTRGTYGVPYIYRRDDRFYFADGNITWLKKFNSSLLPEFLYYWIKTYEGQKKFDAIAKGTAQKAVPIAAIKKLELNIPPIGVQRRIVNILYVFDELIENNRKQIKLLEEAAQRLYKEWFVDLRFPGHEDVEMFDGVPEGWNKCFLRDIVSYEIGGGWGKENIVGNNEYDAYVIRGTDIDGLKEGALLSIPHRFHTKNDLTSHRLKHGDIVFEVSGGSRTMGVARSVRIIEPMLKRWDRPVICASFCKLVRPLNEDISQYLFDHLRYLRESKITEEFDKRSASSIVNYRWKDFLNQRILLYPEKGVLDRYSKYAMPIYERIMTLSIQIESARTSRDLLIPKLMSGEIEV